MLIHRNLMTIDINQSPVLCSIQIKQTNISIFSPIFGLTVSFATYFDLLCTAIETHEKDAMTNYHALDRAGNITNFTENCTSRSFLYLNMFFNVLGLS